MDLNEVRLRSKVICCKRLVPKDWEVSTNKHRSHVERLGDGREEAWLKIGWL